MKYVALLRGINVGGKNKIVMDDLKNCFKFGMQIQQRDYWNCCYLN